jgi:hypothetical protein
MVSYGNESKRPFNEARKRRGGTGVSVLEIGCCGAYCKTCKAMQTGTCKGCKHGYESGARDISKARCKIKVCCVTKGYATCADCSLYEECPVIQPFHHHKGYKYGKYRQAVAFIRENGYEAFLRVADGWKNACGPLGTEEARHADGV